MVLITTVYTKLRPKFRVGTSTALQVLGLLSMFIPVHPVNWWLGLFAMAMGVGSMVGTIMCLTSYASDRATTIFKLGIALSNLLGAVTSKIFRSKHAEICYTPYRYIISTSKPHGILQS